MTLLVDFPNRRPVGGIGKRMHHSLSSYQHNHESMHDCDPAALECGNRQNWDFGFQARSHGDMLRVTQQCSGRVAAGLVTNALTSIPG